MCIFLSQVLAAVDEVAGSVTGFDGPRNVS